MKRPSFQFYPADYLSDMRVRMLSWASRGLYMELLCYCWREGWIPSDSSAIAQLCGCHDLAIVEPCIQLFDVHPEHPGKLIHKRLEAEKRKQDAHKTERSESGKRGAKARWGKGKKLSHGSANGSANGSAIKEPMAKNGSSSSSSNNTPLPPKGEEVDFASIAAIYPKRSHPRETLEAIRYAIDEGHTPSAIIAGTKAIAAKIKTWPSAQFNRYAPSPPKFFRDLRFLDDPATWDREIEKKESWKDDPSHRPY